MAKVVDLMYKLVNSGLLIDEHLVYMLEEDGEGEEQEEEEEGEEGEEDRVTLNVYKNLLALAGFVLGLKNSEMSFQLVAVVKKHVLYVREVCGGGVGNNSNSIGGNNNSNGNSNSNIGNNGNTLNSNKPNPSSSTKHPLYPLSLTTYLQPPTCLHPFLTLS